MNSPFYAHQVNVMPSPSQKIFLDANVLIQEGKAGSPIIERLLDLVEGGLVSVVATDLTMTEVAKKHAENDLNVVKEFTRPHFRAILNEALGVTLPEVRKAALKERLLRKYSDSVARMFKSLDATVLPIDDVRPSEVLEAYSKREGFFSGEGKKDQFPDAFIFACIRKVATARSPIIIVSADGDFEAPAKSEENIVVVKSFPALFDKLGLAIEAPQVEQFLEDNHDELVSRFDAEVSNWSLQAADVEDGEIDETTVTDVSLERLAAFRSTLNGGSILVVGYATVTADVSFTQPDWDTATYDSEDKVAIPWRDVSGETAVELEVRFSLSVSVDILGQPVAFDNLSFLDDSFVYVDIAPYETYK